MADQTGTDDRRMTYGTYLVIHIDVLGQGEALLKLEPARRDRENFEAVVAVLR